MPDQDTDKDAFILPRDLVDAIGELSRKLFTSREKIVIAAVEHFTRIPEQQRMAVLKGTSIRRKW